MDDWLPEGTSRCGDTAKLDWHDFTVWQEATRTAGPNTPSNRVLENRTTDEMLLGGLTTRGLLPLSLPIVAFHGHRLKASRFQSSLNFRRFHEGLPHFSRSIVLDHDQDRALVNAEHFGVPPVGCRIERVAEAVSRPDVRPMGVVEISQRR